MNSSSDLKQRIKSIQDTRQITRAMELISVSKMKKSLKRYENNAFYFHKARRTVKEILLHSKDINHPYIRPREGSRAVYMVITSDRGLAGGYNHNVLNAAWEHMKDRKEKNVITVGHIAREFFQNRNVQVDLEFTHVSQNPTMHDARSIGYDILHLYDCGLIDEAYVVFTKMINASNLKTTVLRLLPVLLEDLGDGQEAEFSKDDLFFDPSPAAVLDVLIPQYLISTVFSALVQSAACEQCARMSAMNTANKNAGEMIEKLNLEFNKLRQEKVTGELLETVSMNLLKQR